MNSEENVLSVPAGNRRRFLQTLAAVGGGLALAPVTALACPRDRRRYPRWHAKSFRLEVKGRFRFDDVVGFYWPFPSKSELTWASCEMRMKFPYEERDLLHLQVFMLPPASEAFFGSTVPVLISDSLTEIEEITVGPPVEYLTDAGEPILSEAKPTFGLMGRVVENDEGSPFGPMVGKIAMFGGAFDHEGKDVNFYLLGGMVAGQHASFARPFKETSSSPFEHARGSIFFHGY